jgi:Cu+-exporting ATPase
LIKGGDTIETFAHIKNIVFDKTGTLTTGEFKIQNIEALDFDKNSLQSILVSLESYSSHPIAKSICKELNGSDSMKLNEVVETKGLSIQGKDKEGNVYKAGGYNIVSHLTKDAAHNVYVLKNDTLIGMVDIMDAIRPEAAKVIAELKRMGIRTIMLSGDNMANCERVAKAVGIDEFNAGQSPRSKIDFMETISLKAASAMVGDGINDAPALAKATIGVSLSNATQIAIQSSQVILLNGDLSLLIKALNITNKTLQTIRQNLFWALSYNLVAIPIAAFGFLNPMWGAAFMGFSDIVVIGNSIRLKTRKIN